MPVPLYNQKKRQVVGTSAPARIPDAETSTPKPILEAIPQKREHTTVKIWTPARIIPIAGVVAIALSVVSFRPSIELIMVAILGEIICSVGIFKGWATS